MPEVVHGDLVLMLETRGDGSELLLFAHGWISSRRMWYDVVDRLDRARFTCALLDFRGAGLSDRPMHGHDLDGYASDLRAALAALERPATVVAHSAGAKIAQFVALEPPPYLARLVLVAPGTSRAASPNPKHRALTEQAFGSRRRIEAFQRAAMARDVPAASLERIVEDALVVQREAWFGWYDAGRGADFSARMHEIRTPTAVIAGQADPLVPLSRVRRDVVEAIGGATLVTLPGVGHNIPVEAADELARQIASAVAAGG